MRTWLEYLPVWLLSQTLRRLPRALARRLGISVGALIYHIHPRLRSVGRRNLELAYPEKSTVEREQILRGVYRSLGRLLAEIPRFPDYTLDNVDEIAVYDGLENYVTAAEKGHGVLLVTAHIGGWEISSFVHSMHGHWMNIVVRDLDNPRLNRYIKQLREMHGNRTHDKDSYARGLLAAIKRGETVAALMDTNMTPPQGVFVNYFGIPACTAAGIAKVAMHTEAAVVPAFIYWDEARGKYVIHFDPAIATVRTGDAESDVVANTQNYTAAIERIVRQHPDQWLWVHRRWKTRPAGEASLY